MKNCKYCRAELKDDAKICCYCGEKVLEENANKNLVLEEEEVDTGAYRRIIKWAILIILNTILVPIFSRGEGLIPRFTSSWGTYTFGDVLSLLADEGLEAFKWAGVCFTTAAFVPAIFLLIAAICARKGRCMLYSFLGGGSLFGLLIYYIDGHELKYAIGENGAISIGFWISLVAYIVCFIISCSQKEDE